MKRTHGYWHFWMCLVIFAIALVPETATAKKGNDKKPVTKGKLVFKYDFKKPLNYTKEFQPVNSGWKVKTGHAAWKQTKSGVESLWESGHMPVLVFNGEFNDAIIEVDFRYFEEQGKWAACRLSATNPQLNPRAYAASVWANVSGSSRSKGMVLEHDEWKPGEITTIDTLKAFFKPGKWYTLRLELDGNDARATCNGFTVSGTHEKFGIPKNSIYLGAGTCKHEFRDLRVYSIRKKIL
ncbi:MAG TPA: DUF1080 domain-containing protein [Mariniphaga anaerophila]|uniref:DUF1080 domain-containing protein n=1 Tax=Mariniphaga anaerophila TaxID=1484053 RepID=A0A831LUH4_9BACT|nr:DUF1080 domain-containing protein [Mariniphaga anaerophila]